MARHADPLQHCLHVARSKLRRSVLSESALAVKLSAAGFDADVINTAMTQLRSEGAVNDQALGKALIDEWQRRKGAGPGWIEQRLAARGLDEALIRQLMQDAGADDAGDLIAQAQAVAEQALPTLRGDSAAKLRKLWGLLARRGYDQDTIEAAVERLDLPRDED